MSFEGWDFSCPDWQDKLAAGKTPIPDLPLNRPLADGAVAFFNKLRIPDVPDQPTFAEEGGQWFRDIVAAAFGSYDPVTLERAIEELFIVVPKKNAKTTNSAGLGLVALLMNRIPNVEGLIVGPTQDVADTCFAQAQGMIEADDYLRRRFHVVEHRKTIIDMAPDPNTGRPMRAKLKVKSFDRKVVTGKIPAFAIIDELHIIATMNHADKILGQITGGAVTQQPTFLVYITTQSEEPPKGVFKAKLKYARGVRDGEIKGSRMLPVIYEFPAKMQADKAQPWKDPATWHMVLPNLGKSVLIEKLLPKYQEAVAGGTAALALWASQHLNIEVGIGLHAERWVGANHWLGAVEESLTLEEILDRSEVVVAGFDGGGLDDLAGLAVLGRCARTRRWLAWMKAWAHPDVMKDRPELQQPFQQFAEDGDLVIVADDDPLQIFKEVTEICVDINDRGLFPEVGAIGLDSQAISDLTDMLLEAGFTIGADGQLQAVPQGWQLTSAIKGLEIRLKMATLRHAGRPIMTWVVGNAKSELRGNNVYISKSMAGVAKIDPLVALFNAFNKMARNPVARGPGIDAFLARPVMVA